MAIFGSKKNKGHLMPMKRVCMVPTDQAHYGPDYNITVDLALTEGGRPINNMTAFGVRGGMAPGSENIEPFLFFADGSVDFGTDWEDEDRDHQMNIRNEARVVQVGELFTFTGGGEEITYRVVQSVDL